MCGALCECLKCPGKVVCCCCQCALNMLLGVICSALVLIVIIGVIVYFTVYKDKDSDEAAKITKTFTEQLPKTFKEYFRELQ